MKNLRLTLLGFILCQLAFGGLLSAGQWIHRDIGVPRPTGQPEGKMWDPHDMQIVYDTRRHVTVGFGDAGGTDGGLAYLPVSEYNGTEWISRYDGSVANAPSNRFYPLVTFDSVRGVTVVFGGYVGTYLSSARGVNDVWEYNGTQWTQRSWTGPGPSGSGHVICFDPNRGRTICLVEKPESGPIAYQTWEWTGAAWEQGGELDGIDVDFGNMVFDIARNRAFVYGSVYDPVTGLNWERVFEYTPGASGVAGVWRQVLINAPATKETTSVSLVYHARLGLIFRSCGFVSLGHAHHEFKNDTHVWDPVQSNWKFLDDGNLPENARRYGAGVCYDRDRDVILLYRGRKPPSEEHPTSPDYFTDMWEWDDHNPGPTYVDFSNFDDQSGSADQPWQKLVDGLKHAPVSGTIFLKAGSTAETFNSSDYRATPVFLRAVSGPVTIGRR